MELKEIKIGEGLGSLKFGMSRDQVIEALGQPDETDNFSEEDLASSSSSVQGLFSAGNRLYRFQVEEDNEYEKYALLMVPLITVEPSGAVWSGYGWEVAECATRDKIPQAITAFCARTLSLVAPEFLDEPPAGLSRGHHLECKLRLRPAEPGFQDHELHRQVRDQDVRHTHRLRRRALLQGLRRHRR